MIASASINRLNSEAWELRMSNQARCLELSQQALEQATQQEYSVGQGYAWRNLGFWAYQTADYAQAIHWLRQGLEVGRKKRETVLERDCLNFLGAVLAVQGQAGEALGYIEQTLILNRKLDDARGLATCLDNMGYLYHRLGQHQQAIKARLEALRICREVGNPVREAYVRVNLATSYIQQGQYDHAIGAAREGLDLAKTQRLEQLQPLALQNLGEALGETGAFIEALQVLQQSVELAERLGSRQILAQGWHKLAGIHLHLNQGQQARELLGKALEEANALGIEELRFQVHERLYQSYKRMGNFEQALYHHERFLALERSFRNAQAEQRLRTLSVQHELEQTQAKAELAQVKNVELAQALAALEEADRDKTLLLHQLELQVTQDPLTKVHNRRYLETVLNQEFGKAKVNQHPLPVAMLDVDNFKLINDSFGHQMGDKVLQTVAQVIGASARLSDVVARFGGEEFVLVLPRTTPEQAIQVCERIRLGVEQYPWTLLHPDLKVTLSLGLSADSSLSNHEKLLGQADAKLYQAKHSGKNQLQY